jgi:hypothetical protein
MLKHYLTAAIISLGFIASTHATSDDDTIQSPAFEPSTTWSVTDAVDCVISGQIFNVSISSKMESDRKEITSREYRSQTTRLVHMKPTGSNSGEPIGAITFVSSRIGGDSSHLQPTPLEGKTYAISAAVEVGAITDSPGERELLGADRFTALIGMKGQSIIAKSSDTWRFLRSGLTAVGTDEVASVLLPEMSCGPSNVPSTKLSLTCRGNVPDSNGFTVELRSELGTNDATHELSLSRSTFTWSKTTKNLAPAPDTEIVVSEQHQCVVEASQARQ